MVEAKDEWRWGPFIGMSSYGVIGCEIQNDNIGVTLAIPTSISLRVYLKEVNYKWFLYSSFLQYKFDEEETIDKIQYEEFKKDQYSLGIGYKWRWKNHWELSASLAIGYYEEERSNNNLKRVEDGIVFNPGLIFGYIF